VTHPVGRPYPQLKRLSSLLVGSWLVVSVCNPAFAFDSSQRSGARRSLALPITENSQTGNPDRVAIQPIALLDGQVQSVQGLQVPAPPPSPAIPPQSWQVVVYFDAPLATREGLRRAARALSREAERLTLLGTTEIVIADPLPRLFLAGSKDPATVREALLDAPEEALTAGELQWHRQRYATGERDEDAAAISQALREELDILARHRSSLFRWSIQKRASGPRLLILVQNGYDANPRAFYEEQLGGNFLVDPRQDSPRIELARTIAGEGWTVFCLAFGPRPTEFIEPSAPLFELARATSGAVIPRHRDLSEALDRAARWPILSLELSGTSQPGPLPLEIVDARTGRSLQTSKWASLSTSPLLLSALDGGDAPQPPRAAVQLLQPEGIALKGELKIRTVASHKRIDRVVFFLDDEMVAETTRSPYAAVIDLGPRVEPHEVTVAAFSKSGRKLGEDSMQLNIALEPPIVTIERLEYSSESSQLSISAKASTPAGLDPEKVEIFFNNRSMATFDGPPIDTVLPVGDLQPTDVVKVLAHYPNGDKAEAAEVPGAAGIGETMDVNLVELLAMVTPRNGQTQIELEQTDFRIHQQGTQVAIDHFSRWEEVSLTLGLVLDTSDSMQEILDDAREAGERFFSNALSEGDKAFVVDFNNLPRLARQATSDSRELRQSLSGLEAGGDTALYDAIVFALQQFETSEGRRALVIVTDGEDSASFYEPAECVRQAKLLGVPVYLIILGPPPDPRRHPSLLRNLVIADRSGGEVYFISDLDDLSQIYDQIVRALRQQYFLAFNTGHTLSPEELDAIEVEVVPKGVSVRTLLASQQRGG
jgi:VWFA-related protein